MAMAMASSATRSWVSGGLIGAGAFGSVSLAVDNETGELFAVKSAQCGRSDAAALENELAILQSLESPRIVRCLGSAWSTSAESGEPVRNVFLEYMPGGSIADLMAKLGGKLHERLARIYTRGILEGLDFLHRKGIVHCDIKGKNVLVGATGVKLADFGAAKRLASAQEPQSIAQQQEPIAHQQQSIAQSIRGTPLWMAPEVVRQEEQGPESDIWSLGCTVLEMITGRAPWGDLSHTLSALYRIGFSDDLPELPSALSDQGKDFVKQCLRRDPRERWTSAELLRHPFVTEAAEAPLAIATIATSGGGAAKGDLDSAEISKLLGEMPVAADEEEEEKAEDEWPRRRLVRPRLAVFHDWECPSDVSPNPGSGGKWIVVRSPQGKSPDAFDLLSDFEAESEAENESGSSGLIGCDQEKQEGSLVEEDPGQEEEEDMGCLDSSPADDLEEESCSCETAQPKIVEQGMVRLGYGFQHRQGQEGEAKIGFFRVRLFAGGARYDRPTAAAAGESRRCGEDPARRVACAQHRSRVKSRSRSRSSTSRRRRRKRRKWRWIVANAGDDGGDDELVSVLVAPDSCVECKSRLVMRPLFDSLRQKKFDFFSKKPVVFDPLFDSLVDPFREKQAGKQCQVVVLV